MSIPKPDSEGYITVAWPSKTIPHGGIMHTRVAEPTPERQQFLKVLLEESKLTITQRKKGAYTLRQPDERKESEQRNVQNHHRQLIFRPRTSKRRSLSAIRAANAEDDYVFKPLKRGEDREKLKDRLANVMAYGAEEGQKPPSAPKITKPAPQLPTAKEQWHELLSQIRERAEWLAEMEVLGHADQHRNVIQDQIAERIRALKALGVDSECSSIKSGFSTTRSREYLPTARSGDGSQNKVPSAKSVSSVRSTKSQDKDKPKEGSGSSRSSGGSVARKKKENDETVTEYGKMTPLRLSPRRRQ